MIHHLYSDTNPPTVRQREILKQPWFSFVFMLLVEEKYMIRACSVVKIEDFTGGEDERKIKILT